MYVRKTKSKPKAISLEALYQLFKDGNYEEFKKYDGTVEMGLLLLSTMDTRAMTLEEIAACCGCSRQYIEVIELSAMNKIRQKLHKSTVKSGFHNKIVSFCDEIGNQEVLHAQRG